MWVNIIMVEQKDMANTPGEMVTATLANFITVKRMGKDTGENLISRTVINIQVNTRTTKNKVMENFNGTQAPGTKVIMLQMLRRGTVRCIGRTEVYTEVSGRMECNVG